MDLQKERVKFFTELWDVSPDQFWLCEPLENKDYRLLIFNNAVKSILPKAKEGILYSELIGDDFLEVTNIFNKCVKGKKKIELDRRIGQGENKGYYRIILIPVIDNNKVVRIWGTARDITELTNARHRAEELAHSLEQTVNERTIKLKEAISELADTNRKLLETSTNYQRLALHDSLTGLANRRSFEESGKRELARVNRYGVVLSLLLLDMDDLKRINDEHGHLAGDAAIKRVAEALIEECRASDLPARLGGDEFALLMPQTEEAQALKSARRILESLKARGFSSGNAIIPITVSIGLASAKSKDSDINELYARADHFLYKAKNTGKNKVEWE